MERLIRLIKILFYIRTSKNNHDLETGATHLICLIWKPAFIN